MKGCSHVGARSFTALRSIQDDSGGTRTNRDRYDMSLFAGGGGGEYNRPDYS
jgi:hypothetical protein